MTKESILEYIKSKPALTSDGRSWAIVDVRRYLMAILFYEFRMTEEAIAEVFNRTHGVVCRGKKAPYYLIKNDDSAFMINTREVRKLFPCNLPEPTTKRYAQRTDERSVFIQKRFHKKLDSFKEMLGVKSDQEAIDRILKMVL